MLVVVWALLFISVLGVQAIKVVRDRRKRRSLPPGPPGDPIIGNLRDLPPADKPIWLYWLEYKDKYGKTKVHRFDVSK